MFFRSFVRSTLGSVFVANGANGVRDPAVVAAAAKPLITKALVALPDRVSERLPQDPQTYVRINGAVQAAAGLALARGRLPRVSAAVLAGTIIPLGFTTEAFWRESDPALKAQKKASFFKNFSLVVSLLLASIVGKTPTDLSWADRRTVRNTLVPLSSRRNSACAEAGSASRAVTDRALEIAEVIGEKAGERWADVSAAVGAKTAELSETAREKAPIVAQQAKDRGAEIAKAAQQRGAELVDAAGKRGAAAKTMATEHRLKWPWRRG
ncbi:DoxX family membrane protein [Mycobacteroides abscessus]|uniref:DoxX family membrane protein n=1 Tax=Mycobacteroides abscessus TaxID=36809 RepID=UPI0009264D6F|nr:DoxX family membrane protein [Mycobacteroides abscessus]SHQ89236.1 DoxX family protein [Mycobacteroides abscessus subsp. bolletii]SHR73727.1 DoxX family protein [Mycobacteroides abscessus subsp. bolletii]SHT17025.1 DoxX family protein [Mycobacteroides abscessus subsp. bolletii]SKG05871.1 DoxX family protein [Mycobacteroides abscessus subsp. bolletii]SKG72569.1 DoxX family protein [Mycobacteroides abscessus subsp. bolletii]